MAFPPNPPTGPRRPIGETTTAHRLGQAATSNARGRTTAPSRRRRPRTVEAEEADQRQDGDVGRRTTTLGDLLLGLEDLEDLEDLAGETTSVAALSTRRLHRRSTDPSRSLSTHEARTSPSFQTPSSSSSASFPPPLLSTARFSFSFELPFLRFCADSFFATHSGPLLPPASIVDVIGSTLLPGTAPGPGLPGERLGIPPRPKPPGGGGGFGGDRPMSPRRQGGGGGEPTFRAFGEISEADLSSLAAQDGNRTMAMAVEEVGEEGEGEEGT